MSVHSFQAALQNFAVISLELIALFIGVSFVIALVREYLPETVIQGAFRGRGLFGNVVGAGFGALTPFCSCSTIPITVGLLHSGAPFGATMSFLLASPIMNPVIIALLVSFLGWRVALWYAVVCFVMAVVLGAVWQALGLERYVKKVRIRRSATSDSPEPESRLQRALRDAIRLFRDSVPYLLLGAAVGAVIYGIVPEAWITAVAGPDKPWAIPVAAVLGVPLYIRSETLIPIGMSLYTAGMDIGAVMALLIAGAGASIPEVSMLGSIFRPRLLAAFVLTVFGVAIVAGYAAHVLFA